MDWVFRRGPMPSSSTLVSLLASGAAVGHWGPRAFPLVVPVASPSPSPEIRVEPTCTCHCEAKESTLSWWIFALIQVAAIIFQVVHVLTSFAGWLRSCFTARPLIAPSDRPLPLGSVPPTSPPPSARVSSGSSPGGSIGGSVVATPSAAGRSRRPPKVVGGSAVDDNAGH